MCLIPWEEERLQIFAAAELARRHRAAGVPLNQPEAVAIICDAMLEAARAGAGYRAVEAAGRAAVDPADVMDGVRELISEVRLEVLRARLPAIHPLANARVLVAGLLLLTVAAASLAAGLLLLGLGVR